MLHLRVVRVCLLLSIAEQQQEISMVEVIKRALLCSLLVLSSRSVDVFMIAAFSWLPTLSALWSSFISMGGLLGVR